MQHFYFHLVGCKARVLDGKGISLPDLGAAKAAAQLIAAMHVFQAGHAEPFTCNAAIEVCDKTGAVVHLEWCRFLKETLTAIADRQDTGI